jgi:hypothetical protein
MPVQIVMPDLDVLREVIAEARWLRSNSAFLDTMIVDR